MKLPVRLIPLILVVALLASGCGARRGLSSSARSLMGQGTPDANQWVSLERGPLTAMIGATGTARSAQSATVTWQTSGKVGKVNVRPGQVVKAGDILAELDPASLPQNVLQAQVDLINAQKALDDLYKTDPLLIAQAETKLEEAQKSLDDLLHPPESALAEAELAVINAKDSVKDAQYALDSLTNGRGNQELISQARATYLLAQDRVDRLEDVYQSVPGSPNEDAAKAQALSNLAGAKIDRNRALASLNWYLGKPSETELAEKQNNLALAKAKQAEAEKALADLKSPPPTDLALAKASVEDAQDALDKLKNGPSQDDVTIAQTRLTQAQAAIAMAHLEAPFDGTITEVQSLPGDLVSAGRTAFRLDDLSSLFIDLQVSEVDIQQVQVGQPVNLTFDALPGQDYTGEVHQIGLVGVSNQGAVYYLVTIKLSASDPAVKSGMTAVADIQVAQVDDVLQLPNQAIQEDNGKRFVYLVNRSGNQVDLKQVYVQIGVSSDTASEVISSELKEGDLISLTPPAFQFPMSNAGGSPGGGGESSGGGQP